jgi:hypothetical protein
MNRMKYSMLIAALAAVALASVGCEQKVGGDKVGKSDQANPSMMGKAQSGGDQTAQSSPAPSGSPSGTDQSKPDQSASSGQMGQTNPSPSTDQDKSKAPDQEKKQG